MLIIVQMVSHFAVDAGAQLPTIALTAISQPAAQVGSTIELRLSGSQVDELQDLLFSQPGLQATVRTSPPRLLQDQGRGTNVFDITIAPTASAGWVDLRALGRFGLSNPRRLLLSHQDVVPAISGHASPSAAMPLPTSGIVVDHCVPQQRNYFRIQLMAGQHLRCCAYAQAIDSKASLNLLLLNENKAELDRSRAVGSWPAEVEYTSQRAQEVFLVVHDFLFQGGEEYPFLVEAKLGDAQSESPVLELDALLRPSNVLLSQANVADPAGDQQLPFTCSGRFADGPMHVDFNATAQQRLSIQVRSFAIGELTDPALVIYKLNPADAANPIQLASQDDAPPLGGPAMRTRRLDPSLVWTVPEDARYRITVRDNQTGQRPADATEFSLSVRPVNPSVRLLAYRPYPSNNPAGSRPLGANLMRGGTEAINVLAIREDEFAGPIALSIENLPAGVSCAPTVIAAGESEASLILRCGDDAPAWHGSLHIVGQSQLAEQAARIVAEAATIAWPASGTRNAIQHRATAELMGVVNPLDTAPVLVELGDGSPIEVSQGAKASIPIKLTRREGGQVECVLRPQSLPPKSTLGEIKIAADANEATAELNIAGDAPVGEYSLWMQNEVKVKLPLNPQALAREQAYLAQLTAALETADEQLRSELNAAITASTATVEELKKQTAEREFTAWLPSTAQTIRITPKP